jgi:hypothetical protein
MNDFYANDELVSILLKNGFLELSSGEEKAKGKRTFKQNKNSKKEIHFNYINIEVINGHRGYDFGTRITEEDLKVIFLLFFLNSTDYKLIDPNYSLKKDEILNRLDSFRTEISINLKDNNLNEHTMKLKRIIDAFELSPF